MTGFLCIALKPFVAYLCGYLWFVVLGCGAWARIASEEGVAAMEARAIELKRKKPGSQNSISGLAAAGGEGWLYFWNVTDTRFP
jgi:hypothetical protein